MAGSRKAEPIDLAYSPGLLMDRTQRNAKGRWVDGNNVRWRDGLPEKMGGYVPNTLTNDEGTTVTYKGKARTSHTWDALDGSNWIAVGAHKKLYLISDSVLYDITPVRKTSSIVNGLSTSSGSAIVTVRDEQHDAAQGDFVRYSESASVGGLVISGEYEITSVVDIDTYTITHTSAATSPATNGGGSITASYDISIGLESDSELLGFGTGQFGEETFGTPRSSSGFIGGARIWSLDNWGEDLLASPNGGALYWWDKTLGPQSRAVVREDAPQNIEHMLIGPDGRHVIALGANLASTGQQDKMFVRWCVGDDFDDWELTTSNDAGSKRLDVGSRLITAVKTRTTILLFTDKGLYVFTYVGGQDVYSVLFFGESVQIVSPNAVVDVGGVVFFMGQDDFYYFNGTLGLLECEISRYVFGSADVAGINRMMQSKVQACYNKAFNEVAWHFPSGTATENDRVAIYNTKEKCWYKSSDLAYECAMDYNRYYGYPIGFYGGEMFLNENGVDAGVDEESQPVAMEAMLTGYEAEVGGGGSVIRTHHLIPDFKSLTGSVSVSFVGRKYPGQSQTQSVEVTVTSSTEIIGIGYRNRQIGLKVRSAAVGDWWRMDTCRLVATVHGGR